MEEYFTPQINTLTDRANFVLYGTANAALCVGVEYFFSSPKLTAAAFVASTAFNYLATTGYNDVVKRNFPSMREAELPFALKDLPDVVNRLSEKFGLNSPSPFHVIKRRTWEEIVADLKDDPHEDKTSNDAARNKHELALVKAYKKYASAFTYGTKETGIIVSENLIRPLPSKARAFLIAHELGHQAARHLEKIRVPNILGSAAGFAASANFLLAVFSDWTGWMVPFAGYVAATKSGPLARSIVPDSVSERNFDVVPNVQRALGVGAMCSAAYFTHNPVIIGTWAASYAVGLTAKCLNASYSRCNEYQADRLAAEAIGDPRMAAASLLRIVKIDDVFSGEPKKKNSKQTTFIGCLFKRAGEAFSSHPTVEKRVIRLKKMATRSRVAEASPV